MGDGAFSHGFFCSSSFWSSYFFFFICRGLWSSGKKYRIIITSSNQARTGSRFLNCSTVFIWNLGLYSLQTGEERSGNERHRLYENEAMRRARFGEGGAFAWCSGVCSFLYSVLFCPSVHSVIESFFFHLYFFYIYIAAVCVIIFLETTVC